MITLIAAAVAAAAQPAPMPAQGQMPMNHAQHEAMKDKCCCEHMGEGGHAMHDEHAPNQPQDPRGE